MKQFAMYSVQVGKGFVALAPMPGAGGDYVGDLEMLRDWRPDLVVSMTTDTEMLQAGAERLGSDLGSDGIQWVPLPIEDFGAPHPAGDPIWADLSAKAASILDHGGRVLVHCRGGCGRSGMIVLRLMVEHGEHPDTALKRLRSVRACAVETDGQRDWASQPWQAL